MEGFMQKTLMSKDWFLRAPGCPGKKVDLPNDYSITLPRDPNAPDSGSNGYIPGGNGCYTKYFELDSEKRHYILDIDGAYMCTNVIFNEYEMVMHPHGYTPLLVDLTKRVNFGGMNKLEISTLGLQPSTRWYSGAGIYRDVFLWTGGDIRIEPWDIFVKTPDLSGRVIVECTISADRNAEISLKCAVADDAGNTVTEKTVDASVDLGKNSIAFELQLDSPKLWDTENPNLYSLHIDIAEESRVLDSTDMKFGIRTIAVDAVNGFRLNGKQMNLRGGCIHHDHGVLGAADYPAACRRKLKKLQEAGFNALRIAHNPPSLTLLELCDSMGIIVMDEAFDMWRLPKGGTYNYHLWFADWWQRDISYMVLRDRNHPCVICYSIGNEIPESDGASDGGEWTPIMTDEIRKYDDTRFVTSATWQMCPWPSYDAPEEYKKQFIDKKLRLDENGHDNSWAERTREYFAPFDICGYNYAYQRYEEHHELFPERVIWGSETHAINFYDSWHSVLRNSYVIGDFTWTAYDNLGEAGTGRACWAREGKIKGISLAGYPWRTCYQGDLDLCGFRRPQSYFREAVWQGGSEPRIFTTHPEHFGEDYTGTGWHWYDVLDTWTFADEYIGKPVKCEVYTDADEIEWIVNGRILGRTAPIKAIAVCYIPYQPGEITAVAYKNGEECGRSSLHTVKAPSKLTVIPESASLTADNRDLCYFDIYVTDENGDRIPDAKAELECSVDGGELLGIFSGDPANEDQYGSNKCHTFEGRAVAIVRASTPGRVSVNINSSGLSAGHAVVEAM